jgi:pyrroloquinoline quinone biosynthesis protein B
MRIRLLGTAAGGGVPQWNCNCGVCREARTGSGRVLPRTQSSIAVTADDRHWFLLNASPDLRAQTAAFPPLHPPAGPLRGSPIEAVLLTNADLDHTLGLFLLREGEKLPVHATPAIRQSLTYGLSVTTTLQPFCGVEWIISPPELSTLPNRDGTESGIRYQSVRLAGRAPRFVQTTGPSAENVVGYLLVDRQSQGRLLCLPDVACLDSELKRLLPECDLLLFDGTFWSEDEMERQGVSHQRASQMGHVPISGPEGSLQFLKQVQVRHKVYVHINNTNPILLEDSSERRLVLEAGCQIGQDGMEFIV